MADKGIYTAVSGAMAQNAKLETISNNLANVNTPAFKRDQLVFQEYLTSYEKAPDTLRVPRVPASIESFYDMNGGDKSYVDTAGSYTDFTGGGIKPTGNALDLAIEGDGVFEILTPQGIQFTRSGNFTLDGEGRLVTKEGHFVLLEGYPKMSDPESRIIATAGESISVGDQGEIRVGDQILGRLSLMQFEQPDSLSKVGGGRYVLKDGYNPAENFVRPFKVHQGFIEQSNVNIVREMTDMLTTTRVFESTQKAIQAYDQMKGKLISEIPKL
jgi:flagellar basal-body rod protein FlgF